MGNKQGLYKIRSCMETFLVNIDANVAVSERLNFCIKSQLKIKITNKHGLEDLDIRKLFCFIRFLHMYLLANVIPIAEQRFGLNFVPTLAVHVAQVPLLDRKSVV